MLTRLELAIGDAFLTSRWNDDKYLLLIPKQWKEQEANDSPGTEAVSYIDLICKPQVHQIPSSSLPWHQSDNCKLPLLGLFAENMIEANNNKCKPDLKAQLKGYLNQWLAYGYLGALELHRRVLCLTSHLCLVTTAGSGYSHNGCTKRLYARVEPSGNFKRVSVPLLNTSGWLSWSRNSDKGRAKLTERQKKGADKCITKVTETFELKKVAEGNRRFRRSKQTSSQPLLYALMSGINLCKSQSSR